MRRQIAWVMILALAMAGGCLLPGPTRANIDFAGSMNVSDEGFSMEGTISNINAVETPRTFENVSVYLADNDEEIIRQIPVGSVGRGSNSGSVSISISAVPHYVVIYSDQFWEVDKIEVDYYVREESGPSEFMIYRALNRDELPVRPVKEANISSESL